MHKGGIRMSKQLKCMMITDSQAQLQYKCVKKKQKKKKTTLIMFYLTVIGAYSNLTVIWFD